jgi:hypothetical protein
MTKPQKPKSGSAKELWSTKDVQEKLEMSEKSARNFLAAIPIAETKDRFNWYDPEKVLEAAKNRTEKNQAEEGSREWYEIEKIKRQIAKLDFELDVSKGKYMPIEEVRTGYQAQVLATRKHWLEMVEKMPPLLAGLSPAAMQVKLKDYVNESFEKLRNHKFSTADIKRMLKSV